MIQIYTGTGKGKTTQALGQAFRALGYGKRVLMVQFMKKVRGMGEIKAAQRFSKFKILQSGSRTWVNRDAVKPKDIQLAQEGLAFARQAIESKKYDLIILDELNVAVDFELLPLKKVKQILKDKPEKVEIIITGRYAHPEIVKIADLVSEIKELKHYYRKGVIARKGIEY